MGCCMVFIRDWSMVSIELEVFVSSIIFSDIREDILVRKKYFMHKIQQFDPGRIS